MQEHEWKSSKSTFFNLHMAATVNDGCAWIHVGESADGTWSFLVGQKGYRTKRDESVGKMSRDLGSAFTCDRLLAQKPFNHLYVVRQTFVRFVAAVRVLTYLDSIFFPTNLLSRLIDVEYGCT